MIGSGASANAAFGSIVEGTTPVDLGSNPGINIPPGVTGISIRNLRVQNFDA